MRTSKMLGTLDTKFLAASLGAISLMVCIGVSRFGYSVLIDHLLKEDTFSLIQVGLVGTSDLFGYLVGSMWCLLLGIERNALYVLRWGTLGCAVTLRVGVGILLSAMISLSRQGLSAGARIIPDEALSLARARSTPVNRELFA